MNSVAVCNIVPRTVGVLLSNSFICVKRKAHAPVSCCMNLTCHVLSVVFKKLLKQLVLSNDQTLGVSMAMFAQAALSGMWWQRSAVEEELDKSCMCMLALKDFCDIQQSSLGFFTLAKLLRRSDTVRADAER